MNPPQKPAESKFHCACGRPELGLEPETDETRLPATGVQTPPEAADVEQDTSTTGEAQTRRVERDGRSRS